MNRVLQIDVFYEIPAVQPFEFFDSDWWMSTLEVHPWLYFVIGTAWILSATRLAWACRRP